MNSTVINTNVINTDVQFKSLERRVYDAFKKENFFSLGNLLLNSFLVFIAVLFLMTIAEIVFDFSPNVRTSFAYSFLLSFVSVLIFSFSFFLKNLKNFNPIDYSFEMGNHYSTIKDKVSNALSLYKNKSVYTSHSLVNANLEKVSAETSGLDFGSFINYKKLSLKTITFFVLLFSFLGLILFNSGFSNAFGRLLNFKENNTNQNNINTVIKNEKDNFLKSFTVKIIYPEYTKLQPVTLAENTGDLSCIEGSKIEFKIVSAVELSYAGLDYGGTISDFKFEGSGAEGIITADKEGTYRFVLKDKDGKENFNRASYNIKLLKDESPKISIIQPQENTYNIYGEKEILLKAIISDDFGFSKLVLNYKSQNSISTASGNFNSINIPITNLNATSLEVPYLWALAGLKQGSGFEYFMTVTDNSGKSTESAHRFLVFNSMTDYFKKTETKTNEIKSDLKSLLEDFKNLQKDIQELKKSSEELGVNEQRKKDLQNKVDNVQKNLDNAQNKIDQSINDLKQNPVLSEKTLEQFMKLQELFNKINTPEFREMLRKLQDAMKKNNEQMKQDLNKMNFDEEAFKKQLEQVIELMKKIENLQKLGELTQKLDELTKKQEELKKETEQTPPNNESKMNSLADKQKQIQEDFKKFKDDMKNLSDNMKNTKNEMDTKDLDNLLKKMNEKKTDSKMQKSSSELFKQQKEQSEKTQDDIQQDMNEFNEEMQNSLENAMNNMDMNNKAMDKMKQIKKNLEKLSEQQQDLKERTGDSEKKELNDLSKEQRSLKSDLTKEIEDLMNMTKEGMQMSPELGKELGNAYNKMENANSNMQKSDKDGATNNQGKAKESLDNAAKMLGDMISKMGKQPGKGNEGRMGQLMQRLGQMISQQQGVNGQMNKMGQNGKLGKDGKGGQEELSQEQKEQMDRLRLEQMNIQKSLEQLNEEFEKEKQRSGDKLLGDMNEVQKDMQESIRQMSKYELDTQLLDRQNKIISRMLDAQLSQREKDFEQKRESKPGDNVKRQSPQEIILSGPRTENSIKEDLLRIQRQGFSEDYEELVKEYFKLLGK